MILAVFEMCTACLGSEGCWVMLRASLVCLCVSCLSLFCKQPPVHDVPASFDLIVPSLCLPQSGQQLGEFV